MKEIRISCAALASIFINNKYLVCVNKNALKKGVVTITPFGGGTEYKPEALNFLNNLGAKFERSTPDLRFRMLQSNIELFELWFFKKKDREIGIDRELIEEIVMEEEILTNLTVNDFSTEYVNCVENIEGDNHRYFEIYDVKFNDNIIKELLNSKKPNLKLVSKEEILNGMTNDGVHIGTSVKSILR